jgi:hypothetical protein
VADQKKPDEDTEAIRQAGDTPDGEQPSTPPRSPPPDEDQMKRSAESGEGDLPDEDLPSNRAQERGGP